VGGTGAVNANVEAALNATLGTKAARLAGSNRYETSTMVANRYFPGNINALIIASGKTFPDGLSGGPVAEAYDAPLLLVADNAYDHAVSLFKNKGARTLVVMGGTGAVSKKVAETIAAPAKEE